MVKNTYYCSEQTMKQYRMIENLDYEMHHDLAVEYVNDGIVYPLERNICPDYEQYGGVTDKNGNFIRLSLLDRHIFDHEDALKPYRDWYIGANPKYERQDIKKIDETVVFFGVLYPHYCHAVLEMLSRIWYFLDRPYCKAVYIADPEIKEEKCFLDFVKAFGFPLENLMRITQPTRFKQVIIPEQSFRLHDKFHKKHAEVLNRIKQNLPLKKNDLYQIEKKQHPRQFPLLWIKNKLGLIRPDNYKKIYLLKDPAFTSQGTPRFSDLHIGKIFKKNGYKLVNPERISVTDVVKILSLCEDLVAQSGTNAHQIWWMKDKTKLTVLNRSRHACQIQNTLSQMKDMDTTYIDASFNPLPVGWMNGPFLMCVTTYLRQFFQDKHFKYKPQKEQAFIKKHLYDFLLLWAKTNIYGNGRKRLTWDAKETARDMLQAFSETNLKEQE